MTHLTSKALFALMFAFPSLSSFASTRSQLQTKAEQTDFVETGRYDEVEKLCGDFQKHYPNNVRCFEYGKTPENRPMLAMAIGGQRSQLLPSRSDRTVVAFQGGIHAGEIDGKDAGFWFIRDVLERKVLPDVLNKVTLLFIPVFNVDGHERFAAYSRPNQSGPIESGWRVTAQNYNLNRDYLKIDAPEMKAMIALLNEWNPILYADLHVTDGAKFQQDIAVMIEPSNAGPAKLRDVAAKLSERTMKNLTAAGNLPLSTYPSFIEDEEPKSGLAQRPARPGFSNGYWAYRNRIGVLVETHSWRPYKHRVKATYETLKTLVSEAAEHGPEWVKAAKSAEDEGLQLPAQKFPLSYKNTDKKIMIDFLGYAYTRTLSKVSGQLMTRYDDKKPEVWRIPFSPDVEGQLFDQVPKAFIIPLAYKSMFEDRLKLHGIRYEILSKDWQGPAQFFRAHITGPFKAPNESHQKIDFDGAWTKTDGKALAGSLRVEMNQPLSRLAMMLLNPMSPDSLFAWGYLNQIFERKEYMETYVAEEVAEEMLKNTKIKEEFETLLKDPEFAKSAEKRLDFFAAKHPSFDIDYLKYPVLRVD